MTTFVSIILLAFCILQIILFFKVWRMTNNVKKIKNKLYADDFPAKDLYEKTDFVKNIFYANIQKIDKLIYIGENEAAKKMLLSMKYEIEVCFKSKNSFYSKKMQELSAPLLSKIEEYLEKL